MHVLKNSWRKNLNILSRINSGVKIERPYLCHSAPVIPYDLGQMYDLLDILQIVVSLSVNYVDWETEF